MSAVPLEDVKKHLQMQSTANDVELQTFIDAAEAAIAHKVGPLAPISVTERANGGGPVLVLQQPRAVSLTSATYADGTVVTLSDLDLDGDAGLVYWNYGTAGAFWPGRRNVQITYTAGFATLPADLVQAVKELTRHLWETQRGNNTARPGFTDEASVAGAFSSWPLRVQELIEPYLTQRIA